MIYYYFESKEGLYKAVLENVYREIRTREADLGLEKLAPEKALRKLVESTVEYDDLRPHLFRLVAIENINYGRTSRPRRPSRRTMPARPRYCGTSCSAARPKAFSARISIRPICTW